MATAMTMSPVSGTKLATMMISGSPGSTRKMLESAERISSTAPPRNPALTPTRTDRAVAMTAASSPTTRTPRVPTRICEKTSCPVCVVPNQWSPEGGRSSWSLIASGSYGASHGPATASRTKNASRIRPVRVFPPRRNRSRARRTGAAGGGAPSRTATSVAVMDMGPQAFRIRGRAARTARSGTVYASFRVRGSRAA